MKSLFHFSVSHAKGPNGHLLSANQNVPLKASLQIRKCPGGNGFKTKKRKMLSLIFVVMVLSESISSLHSTVWNPHQNDLHRKMWKQSQSTRFACFRFLDLVGSLDKNEAPKSQLLFA